MSLKQFFLALVLGSVLIQAGLSCAKAQPPYEISVEDEFGNVLPTYAHRGEWFAQGRAGQRYNVRIRNRSSLRVEAVITVDGRDVLSGRPGDYKRQRGYLIPAYDSVLIEGFRTSLDEVAAFRFASPEDSYSARMGTPENVGVIGAAFFPEKPYVPTPRPQIPAPPYRYEEGKRGRSDGGGGLGSSAGEAAPSASQPAPSAAKPSRDKMRSAEAPSSYGDDSASNIGTEFGEQRYSAVTEVPFERARPGHPDHVLLVRYDDYEGLVARGVLPRPAPRPRGPSAFPVNRFAPPPPPRQYWN